MLRDDALHRSTLWINGEAFGSELPQLRKHARTWRKRVLVEVEAQRVAAGERRMILRHRQHTSPRLRQNCSVRIEFIHERRCLIHCSLFTTHYSLSFAHSHADAFGVTLQPLCFCKRNRVWTNLAQSFASVLLHGDDLHEIEHAEAAANAPVAARWEHVVRAGDIVAHRLWRVMPDEHRARVHYPTEVGAGVNRQVL